MILVATPTGHTGRHVLSTLSSPARAFVRDAARLQGFGGEVVEGNLRDPSALDGVEAAFFCVPQSGDSIDIPAYYRSFAVPFAEAARRAGVVRIVAIGGDDGRTSYPGIGEGLAEVEAALFSTGADVRVLRCGYFMENFYWMLGEIVHAGRFSRPVAGDVPLAFVAARDLGVAAARLLECPGWKGQEGLAAHGPVRLSCDEAAGVLTEGLGFPVAFRSTSVDAYREGLARHGVSDPMGRSLGEMFQAISGGRDMGRTDMASVDCPTTLRSWITEAFAQKVRSLASVPSGAA